MGQISSTIRGNFLAICLGLAALCAILMVIGWGQGAALVSMVLGAVIMFHVGVGKPVDAQD